MKIIKIKQNSLAQQIGLSIGDRLLKINGQPVLDHLDYEFRITDETVTASKLTSLYNNDDATALYTDGTTLFHDISTSRSCIDTNV